MEAILSYCESVDPKSSPKYQLLRNLVISGHSSEIGDDGESAAYRSELGAMEAALAKIPISTGVSTCKAGIAGM